MSSDETYNGWENYETWAVRLWLDNEEGTYNYVREMAEAAASDAPTSRQVVGGIWTVAEAARFTLADRVKGYCEEIAPDLGASMFSDLLGRAIGRVDWDEIAENIYAEIAAHDAAA